MAFAAPFSLRIQTPRIEIDARAALAEIGLQRPLAFTRAMAATGKASADAANKRIAREGDALAAVESGATMVSVIRQRWMGEEKQLTIAALPSQRPKVTLKRGTVDIQVGAGGRSQIPAARVNVLG